MEMAAMVLLAGVVVPGVRHDVTPRGHERARAFFSVEDYRPRYRDLLAVSGRPERRKHGRN
jgi:hypothetical protein